MPHLQSQRSPIKRLPRQTKQYQYLKKLLSRRMQRRVHLPAPMAHKQTKYVKMQCTKLSHAPSMKEKTIQRSLILAFVKTFLTTTKNEHQTVCAMQWTPQTPSVEPRHMEPRNPGVSVQTAPVKPSSTSSNVTNMDQTASATQWTPPTPSVEPRQMELRNPGVAVQTAPSSTSSNVTKVHRTASATQLTPPTPTPCVYLGLLTHVNHRSAIIITSIGVS